MRWLRLQLLVVPLRYAHAFAVFVVVVVLQTNLISLPPIDVFLQLQLSEFPRQSKKLSTSSKTVSLIPVLVGTYQLYDESPQLLFPKRLLVRLVRLFVSLQQQVVLLQAVVSTQHVVPMVMRVNGLK